MEKLKLINALKGKMVTDQNLQEGEALINSAANAIADGVIDRYFDLVFCYANVYPITIKVSDGQGSSSSWNKEGEHAYINFIVNDGARGFLKQLANVMNSEPCRVFTTGETLPVLTSRDEPESLATIMNEEVSSNPELKELVHDLWHSANKEELASSYFNDVFASTIVNDRESLRTLAGFFPRSFVGVSNVLKEIYSQAFDCSAQEEGLQEVCHLLFGNEGKFNI